MIRTHQATGEALLVAREKSLEQVRPITGKTGKRKDGERVADGPGVATKRL